MENCTLQELSLDVMDAISGTICSATTLLLAKIGKHPGCGAPGGLTAQGQFQRTTNTFFQIVPRTCRCVAVTGLSGVSPTFVIGALSAPGGVLPSGRRQGVDITFNDPMATQTTQEPRAASWRRPIMRSREGVRPPTAEKHKTLEQQLSCLSCQRQI